MFSAHDPSKCTHTRSSGQPTMRHPESSWGLGAPPKGPTLAEDRFAGAETQTHAPGPQVRHSIHQATAALKRWSTSWICMSSFHRGHANLLYIHRSNFVYVPPWRDQLEREIRRYGVSTGPAFNFGDRKQLSGLLKWLLGLKRFSMYWYDVWRYDASMPCVKYRYL